MVLKNKADPNTADKDGTVILRFAASGGHADTAEYNTVEYVSLTCLELFCAYLCSCCSLMGQTFPKKNMMERLRFTSQPARETSKLLGYVCCSYFNAA